MNTSSKFIDWRNILWCAFIDLFKLVANMHNCTSEKWQPHRLCNYISYLYIFTIEKETHLTSSFCHTHLYVVINSSPLLLLWKLIIMLCVVVCITYVSVDIGNTVYTIHTICASSKVQQTGADVQAAWFIACCLMLVTTASRPKASWI